MPSPAIWHPDEIRFQMKRDKVSYTSQDLFTNWTSFSPNDFHDGSEMLKNLWWDYSSLLGENRWHERGDQFCRIETRFVPGLLAMLDKNSLDHIQSFLTETDQALHYHPMARWSRDTQGNFQDAFATTFESQSSFDWTCVLSSACFDSDVIDWPCEVQMFGDNP
jgi:hypothetical protein